MRGINQNYKKIHHTNLKIIKDKESMRIHQYHDPNLNLIKNKYRNRNLLVEVEANLRKIQKHQNK